MTTRTQPLLCYNFPMKKTYLDARDYLHDIWRLADIIRKSDWKPQLILALWRGGAPVGISVHEYLAYAGMNIDHLPIKCKSYTGMEENDCEVKFYHADSVFNAIKSGTRVVVIDDVFDTGKTAEAVLTKLTSIGADARIACVYWKPEKNKTKLEPHYFTKKLDSSWIVFPHEMDGLSKEELQEKSPLLAELLSVR